LLAEEEEDEEDCKVAQVGLLLLLLPEAKEEEEELREVLESKASVSTRTFWRFDSSLPISSIDLRASWLRRRFTRSTTALEDTDSDEADISHCTALHCTLGRFTHVLRLPNLSECRIGNNPMYVCFF
jgi:hypothetical protein